MNIYKNILLRLAIIALVFLFVFIFRGDLILPQGFAVGPIYIRFYGVCVALGVLAAYFATKNRMKHFDFPPDLLDRLLVPVVALGFIGARLYHVLSSLDYYRHHLIEIVQVWHGGLSVYGAVIGGMVAVWIVARRSVQQISVLKILDWLIPGVIMAHLIARLGNFFNYELFGYPTSLPWKMFVPEIFRAPAYQAASFFHPLFLYEILLLSLVLIVLNQIEKAPSRAGTLFLWYVLLYNSGRFFLEFLRIDSVFIGPIRQNAVVSAGLAIIALAALLYYRYAKVPQNS